MTDHEILAGSLDSYIRCYDIRMGKITRDFIGGIKSFKMTIKFFCNQGILCKLINIQWSFVSFHLHCSMVTIDSVSDPVISSCFTQDSQCILASSCDIIRLMDKETGELLSEYKGHKTGDYMIESCLDAKDKYILSGSTDGNLYCWELISNKLVKLFPHPNQKTVHSISAHPSGNYFLTAAGYNVYLWGSPSSESNA